MLKVYIFEGFAFELGPQIGFLLSANYEHNFTSGGESDSVEVHIQDEFKGTYFGAGFGASYKLENGLFFSGRYVVGFSEINEEASNEFSAKNNVIQLSLGWAFN